jgi:hypothetical protein
MATPIDELVIQIRADTKQLQKDLDQIKGKLKTTGTAGAASFAGTSAASGALAGSMAKLAGPAAIGGAVLAMGKLTAFSLKAGMEFEDLKDSLDTVFGSIEAGDKQFRRILQFAQTTPFQIDTVTKSFIALGSVGIEPSARQMQVYADAASVAIDQKGAFEALIRVQQRAAAGALGLQELNMLADRGIDVFKGLKEELGLSRLELTDFGQTAGGAKIIIEALTNTLEKQFGGAMVAKMDNLSVAISNMAISFKVLGNEIFQSGVGRFFKDLTAQATSAVNAMAVAVAAMRGSGLGITLEAPQINSEMNFEQMQSERARAAHANIKKITDEMKRLADTSKDSSLKKFFDNFDYKNLIYGSAGAIKEFGDAVLAAGVDSEDAQKIIKELNLEIMVQAKALGQATKSQASLTAEETNAMLIAGKNVRVMGLLTKSIEDAKGDTDLFVNAQQQLGKIFKDNSGFLIANGIPDHIALGEAFTKLEASTNDVAGSFSEALAPAIQSMSLSFTKDFVDSLLEGQNALSGFQDFAKNIVSAIIATFLQLAVVNTILNSIFGKGTFDQYNWGTGKIDKASAGGGSAHGGQPMIVGERGPELFVPHSSGNIMNGMNTKNAMGGGGTTIINQSINFATGVVPTVRAEVMKMMPQIAEVTKGAVAEAAMRGGNFRRALAGG